MRKILFLVMTLVCMGWSQAYADYSFSFGGSALAQNGNAYTYDFSGILTSLTTTPDSNGYVVITGGTLTSTGSAYNGITFTVAQLQSTPSGNYNGYGYNTVRNTNGDDLFYDNVIAPNSNPILPSAQCGLDLVGKYNGRDIVISLSSSGAGQYVLQSNNTGINDPYLTGWSYVGLNNTTVSATATPTPVPAAAYLLGSGLMGLAGLRRRQKING
ncbi:MAG: VPLPA-CTERM sorting domain-containing protein [Desulfuromonadales bacterium]|nr:VPLPA-CTERM sorting domain-containing protein [Desulfuromonadales bacterium]